jgi:hypothetical protein
VLKFPTELAKDWISLVAAAIALLALLVGAVSYFLNRRNTVTGKQPVIVFEFDQQAGWKIRNIGKGPAMNVVVDVRGKATDWSHPVAVPSVREGAEFTLWWIGTLNVWMLGATYSDFEGRLYTTISQHDAVKLVRGHVLHKFIEVNKDYLPGSRGMRFWNASKLSDAELT